jgi:hypothetical protein
MRCSLLGETPDTSAQDSVWSKRRRIVETVRFGKKEGLRILFRGEEQSARIEMISQGSKTSGQ